MGYNQGNSKIKKNGLINVGGLGMFQSRDKFRAAASGSLSYRVIKAWDNGGDNPRSLLTFPEAEIVVTSAPVPTFLPPGHVAGRGAGG